MQKSCTSIQESYTSTQESYATTQESCAATQETYTPMQESCADCKGVVRRAESLADSYYDGADAERV